MKVSINRVIAMICGIIMLCNSGMGLTAHAQEIVEARIVSEYEELVGDNVEHGIYDIPDVSGARAATLSGCSIGISVSANGVRGSIQTGSTVKASEIGATNIKVEKYVNGKWTLVGNAPSRYSTNDDTCVISVTTSSAEKGVQYRISCTHYAILEGVRHELNNVTKGVSY